MSRKRILSGMQPTGKLHLGNYEGALRNWVKLQEEFESFFFIADWHSLTTLYETPDHIRDNTRNVAIDFLSAGLDPEKCSVFVQSAIKEHAELHLLLSMITPVPWLERVPTYKEKMDNLGIESAAYGLLGYPVLQAADILIYKADVVPVGKDQVPHLELTREIGRRFNNFYGEIFPEPAARLTEYPVMPGIDGRKMSKSYDNAIFLSDTADETFQKVRTMFTDPLKIYRKDPGHPDTCPVFALHNIYSQSETEEICTACKAAELGCVDCKKRLTANLNEALAPIRERRAHFEEHPDELDAVLAAGGDKARAVAAATMAEVRHAMKLG
jgi:tryptophanyl-tRNA synthetase